MADLKSDLKSGVGATSNEKRDSSSTSSHSSTDRTTSHSEPGFSYKGPVSGLKGLLSSKLAEGIAGVVSGLDKVTELSTKKDPTGGSQKIPLDQIFPCPDQPRQIFEPKALEELSQTLREVGQAQAITVRPTDKGYEIISGERRFRAAKLAGLTHLDCVVKRVSATEGRMLALVENVQRQDLLPLEEAQYLKKVLQESPHLSLEKLAKMLGSHKSTLSEKVQLSEVPTDLQPLLFSRGRAFTHRHWRVLSRIGEADLLREMLVKALDHNLSVAELERAVSALGIAKAPRRKAGNLEGQVLPFFYKKDGKVLKFKSVSLDLRKLTETAKNSLLIQLEELCRQIRGSENPVTVTESLQISEVQSQLPSLEIG